MKDGLGAVFDIQNSYYERFLDNYDHIKNQEGLNLDFVVSRCSELPELIDEEDQDSGFNKYNTNNRGGYNGSSGSFGGSRGGGHGGSRGGFQ